MRELLLAGVFALAACGPQNQAGEAGSDSDKVDAAGAPSAADISGISPGEAEIQQAAEMMPSDADLAAKYDRSCRSCHSIPDAGAPLTGHAAAWDARFELKDADGLLKSVKEGLNAMPSMGLCNDCSDEELMALTDFMAGREN